MCLVGISLDQDKGVSIYANRDEFHARPTDLLHYWTFTSQSKPIIAGKDLELGGTWLGIEPQSNRWACILNLRSKQTFGHQSRGHIVTDCLDANLPLRTIVKQIHKNIYDYRPFILLTGDKTAAWALQTGMDELLPLQSGVYSVSNGGLDIQWPKQQALITEIQQLETQSIALGTTIHRTKGVEILKSKSSCIDIKKSKKLPENYIQSLEETRFILSPNYGTRSSAFVHLGQQSNIIFEQAYNPDGTQQSLPRQFTW